MSKVKNSIFLLSFYFISSFALNEKSYNHKFQEDAIAPPSILYEMNEQNYSTVSGTEILNYQEGLSLLKKKKYKKAAEKFANIYYQSPGGPITSQAELMEAYSYYMGQDYIDAMDILDNFIKLHPIHQNIEWAYYLRASSAFAQIHDIYYDQSDTAKAKHFLQKFILKFPHSEFNQDIKAKIDITNDYLNAKEMYIGKYYMTAKNDPIAAISRFIGVAGSDNPHKAEALYRLYENFMTLGLQEEAQDYLKKLIQIFPNNVWANKARKSIKPNLKDDT